MQHHEHNHNPKTFKVWFWVSLVLSIPAFYFSPTWQQIFSYRAIDFAFAGHLPAVIGLALVSSGGLVFFKGAIQELKRKKST